jgi:hypothetical protein
VPGTPAPPNFSRTPSTNSNTTPTASLRNKLPADVDRRFKETDVNKLPRHTAGSEQIVAAIDEVNRRLSMSEEKIAQVQNELNLNDLDNVKNVKEKIN